MRIKIFLLTLLIATLACNIDSGTDANTVRTQVAIELTQTAIAQPAPNIKVTTPTAASPANTVAPATAVPPTTAAAVNGSISGKLSYPSSGIPPLNVCALVKSDLKKFYCVDTALNQTQYTIKDVPAGTYWVVAYTQDGKIAGGYSKAVSCGLSASCSDHSLIDVALKGSEALTAIDPGDWYAPPNTFPAKPGAAASNTVNGSISGALGYPSSGIPPLAVYAISKDDPKRFSFVLTNLNQNSYTIKDLTPGIYVVVAYVTDSKLSGGWTKAVPCGLSVSCTDHSLTPVTVKSGENVTGIDIKDWYAPEGTFPPRPSK